ncbi:MAG: class B sortase [Lachnospiraceae bacterium]|nr:class B sortase [Lachnospiraceae bacterium]
MRFHHDEEPEKDLLDRIFSEETPSEKEEVPTDVTPGTEEAKAEETEPVSPVLSPLPEKENAEAEKNAEEAFTPAEDEPPVTGETAEEDFLNSLEEIAPDDIAPAPDGDNGKGGSTAALLRKLLVLTAVAVFVCCLGFLGSRCYYYYKSYVTYRDLEKIISDNLSALPMRSARQEQLPKSSPDYEASRNLSESEINEYVIDPPVRYSEEFEKMLVRLTLYKQKNEDFFGYLSIPDTAVNYQVVHGTDNDYYLDHDFIRSYDPAGAIFVDCRAGYSLLTNLNTTLYGHHMTGGSTMFHDLDKFADEEFFTTHPYLTIATFEGVFTYEVFAVYETTRYYNYIHYDFNSDTEFLAFCREMKNNSLYEREGMPEFTPDDRILTFSTCTNVSGDGRLCVQARLVSVET